MSGHCDLIREIINVPGLHASGVATGGRGRGKLPHLENLWGSLGKFTVKFTAKFLEKQF